MAIDWNKDAALGARIVKQMLLFADKNLAVLENTRG